MDNVIQKAWVSHHQFDVMSISAGISLDITSGIISEVIIISSTYDNYDIVVR